MKLRAKTRMHARLQGGSMFVYDIVDAARKDAVVAEKTVVTDRRAGTRKVTIKMNDIEFDSESAFMRAYRETTRG